MGKGVEKGKRRRRVLGFGVSIGVFIEDGRLGRGE